MITKAIIRTAGLSLCPIPMPPMDSSKMHKATGSGLLDSLRGLQFWTRNILAETPSLVKAANLDGLVVDQMDFAAGSIAESLHLPFISLSIVPPIYLSSSTPPICFRWQYSNTTIGKLRNRFGNAVFRLFLASVLKIVNEKRRDWGLSEFSHVNDTISSRALISQLPELLDFPSDKRPKQLVYTGPFHDGRGRKAVSFPWERLSGKRLIYASMGTRRNDDQNIFRIIAEACRGIDAQLIVSTGGNLEITNPLPGNPIVFPYVPQLEILSRACLTITHAGINTTLESLSNGVPLVAIPIADDQPGVAARIEWIGAGIMTPYKKISVIKLRKAIQLVLHDPKYRTAAQKMQATIGGLNGMELAADLIEKRLQQ
jgi:UDP:flavonoid glycosyltransferase YjiC (YdhE family)